MSAAKQCVISVLVHTVLFLTLVGTVGMSLVTVVSAVVVAVTGPVFRDAAAAVAFKLDTGARMAAAGFIAVIAAVIVCHIRFDFQLWYCFKIQLHGRSRKSQRMITVIAAPVDVDAAAIGTGELGQGEAGWVG